MEIVNLGCPKCKAHLTLPADKEKNDKLLLICPKCDFRGNPKSFVKFKNPVFETKQNQESELFEPTVIVGHNLKDALAIGSLKDIMTSTNYQLKQGLNRFGRKSVNSICEHQFINNDTFVSRKHFEINVVFNKVTLIYDHRLQDLGSINGTKINRQKLTKGDIILLKSGDRILAGKTELIFEFPLSSEDTTLV